METTTPQIFLYKRGEISAQDKAALKSAGFLPVACKDPNNVAILFPDLKKIKGDEILNAALVATSISSNASNEFGRLMIKLFSKK
jgi:hypothetical protein